MRDAAPSDAAVCSNLKGRMTSQQLLTTISYMGTTEASGLFSGRLYSHQKVP